MCYYFWLLVDLLFGWVRSITRFDTPLVRKTIGMTIKPTTRGRKFRIQRGQKWNFLKRTCWTEIKIMRYGNIRSEAQALGECLSSKSSSLSRKIYILKITHESTIKLYTVIVSGGVLRTKALRRTIPEYL